MNLHQAHNLFIIYAAIIQHQTLKVINYKSHKRITQMQYHTLGLKIKCYNVFV